MKKIILGIILVLNSAGILLGIFILIKSLSTPPIPEIPKEEISEEQKVKEKPGEEENIVNYAVLKMNSIPPQAKVFINGYYKGKTPVEIKIHSVRDYPVIYRVKLLLIGYQIWEESVSLKRGDVKEFTVNLRRE